MDSFRESPMGQLIRFVTSNRVLLYDEEKPGFEIPWQEFLTSDGSIDANREKKADLPEKLEPVLAAESLRQQSRRQSSEGSSHDLDLEKMETLSPSMTQRSLRQTSTNGSISRTKTRESTRAWTSERQEVEESEAMERQQSRVIIPQKTNEGIILVDWYTTDDKANPQNWALKKKIWTTFVLWLYTFVVYCASAIYTPGTEGVMREFGVNISEGSLGLAMFVLGYGFGPSLFSPLSEIPSIGRNIPYITSFTLFVVLSVGTATTPTYGGLLTLRFLTGFLGSPCLATGGATIQDLYSFLKLPYGFTAWVAAAFSAPALGPLISGFAVMAKGWRWAMWEILWMSAPVLVLMYLAFPETSAPNILLRRAQRLRKLTGNANYKSQSEIDQANMSFGEITRDALIKPVQIMFRDPAVFFTNAYSAFIYSIYYSFFEAFPLVYMGIYGFNVGEMGIAFVNIVVACIIGIAIYCSYLHWYLEPDLMKRGPRAQEHRLVPAIFASMGLPVGLFIFAWTSRADIHWIASIIGIAVFGVSAFVLFQCIFMYLPLSYPQYAASLFASNDLYRSCWAAGSIIYGHPLFVNLGVGNGVSVLAGLSILGVAGMWALWYFGASLRARSKFAQS
ncbi:MFS transporter [Polychaeton citri CBS 116435]|uniref:Cercosporin MFS transporter CTB4 n=1 Tax=Polychaeton citri CBS 116435 TaxID=1314669 RepID=A0A9P4UME8_9PEZI|nr:MFS transporter [Polychaeton citri CBS 116435]